MTAKPPLFDAQPPAPPRPFARRALPGRDLSLMADEGCPEGAVSVVFLPGGGQTRKSWRRALQEVTARGLNGLALDLRGHGESDWAEDGDYRLRAMADDTIAALRHLDRPTIVVGASRGGQCAFLAAEALPETVLAAVLVDIIPGANYDAVEEIRAFMMRSAEGFADPGEAAQALATFRGQTAPEGRSTGLARVMRRGADNRRYWHWDPRFASTGNIDPTGEDAQLRAAAKTLRSPVLLVRGGLSALVSDEAVAGLRALNPDVDLVTIEGAGHMITDEQTDVFIDAILQFVTRIAPRHLPAEPR